MSNLANSSLLAATPQQQQAQEKKHSLAQHLVQTFMPINRLTSEHLYSLIRDQKVEYGVSGQTIFNASEHAQYAYFLLHGEVELSDREGNLTRVEAQSPDNRFALGKNQPGQLCAKAIKDCSYIKIERRDMDRLLCWDQVVSNLIMDISSQRELDGDADWMLTLLKSNLFYKVPPHNVRSVLACFTPIEVGAGDRVVRQGQYGDCLYIIKQGIADVYRAEHSAGASNWLAELGPGDCFGEDALINETVRNATVQMREDCTLMRLNKQDFYQLLKHPEAKRVMFSQALQQQGDDSCWIDVRSVDEFELGHKSGALNISLDLLNLQLRRLDKSKTYICYCDSGWRSGAAASLLEAAGFNALALSVGTDYLSAPEQQLFSARA